jgi:hypothetical protein
MEQVPLLPHRKGAHDRSGPDRQVPAPSQRDEPRSVAVGQVGGAQMVPARYTRQAPTPSQVPSRPQVAAPLSAHCPRGSSPADTEAQVPIVPGSAHERQVPVQALPQQTPCSHRPEWHSSAAVQVPPSGFFPQLDAMQVCGARQSASVEQTVRHWPFVPQTYGSQGCPDVGLHTPPALQR